MLSQKSCPLVIEVESNMFDSVGKQKIIYTWAMFHNYVKLTLEISSDHWKIEPGREQVWHVTTSHYINIVSNDGLSKNHGSIRSQQEYAI